MNTYLFHYNPNHDRLGRFTSGPGGAPNDSTVLKKGTTLNTVSPLSDLDIMTGGDAKVAADARKAQGKPLYMYNPEDKWDSKVYKGPFSKYKVLSGFEYLNEHSYKTLKDMRMPTKQQRLDEFKALYNSDKYHKKCVREMQKIQKSLSEHNVGSTDDMKERIKSLDLKKVKSDKEYETAYEIFNHAMEAQHAFRSTTEYIKRMSSKYDAMVDDNNQGIYNGVHDPIIVFKANEFLETQSSRPITTEEIIKNAEFVEKELTKKGLRVKL